MSTTTVVELSVLNDHGGNSPSWDVSHSDATTVAGSRGGYDDGKDNDGNIHPVVDSTTVAESEAIEMRTRGIISPEEDPEMRLPYMGSLCIILVLNALLQFSFFLPVSSSPLYAASLGGDALFSGITIGIPSLASALVIYPLTKYDERRYTRPLIVAFTATILGNILHAVASPAKFLYLILIGRTVSGIGFAMFVWIKQYTSDPRLIGIRRRTTVATWLVLGQAFAFSAGPFVGGLLYKVGFSNKVFNGFTSPGWITASFTALFGLLAMCFFRDVPKPHPISGSAEAASPTTPHPNDYGFRQLTIPQWGTLFSMCWASMTCFFIVGSWEVNIPIFTAVAFGYSPFAAGNFIALGGVATIPFFLANLRYAPRMQDRITLVAGTAIGSTGLLLTLVLLVTDKVVFGSFYVCWVLVVLGFNLTNTCTNSLLSKQFPSSWNARTSRAIQYSIWVGRATGATFGGAGVQIGMKNYIGVQLGIVGIGALLHLTFWKQLKAKTG